MRWRWRRARSSRNSNGWFGRGESQGAILVPGLASPHLTLLIAKIIPTLIGIVTYSHETLR